jgi:hypothetical protein
MIDDVINAIVAVGLCRGFCRLFVITRERKTWKPPRGGGGGKESWEALSCGDSPIPSCLTYKPYTSYPFTAFLFQPMGQEGLNLMAVFAGKYARATLTNSLTHSAQYMYMYNVQTKRVMIKKRMVPKEELYVQLYCALIDATCIPSFYVLLSSLFAPRALYVSQRKVPGTVVDSRNTLWCFSLVASLERVSSVFSHVD